MMTQRTDFPFNLDSINGEAPGEEEQISFQNYYPKSEFLQNNANIVPMSKEASNLIKEV